MMSRNPYAALDRAVEREDREAAATASAKLTDHEKDLLVSCPATACLAAERKECINTPKGKVHFGRRVKRLLGGIR